MPSPFRSRLFSLLIHVAFFASGAASLIAEVTWNRMLIVVVGNSVSAAAMIIAVFMGGLGLGSYLGGRIFGRRSPSLRNYVVLEAAIGVFVILSPAVLGLLSGMFTSLAESLTNRAALTALRLVVTASALIVPALLMGMTFPAIIAAAAPDAAARRSARIGYLYSINTLGAAIGCFFAGYHLLLEFGVRTTLYCALGLYALAVVVGSLAGLVRTQASGVSRRQPEREPMPTAAEAGLRRTLLAATFGIGFVSLAYEVLLTRLSILYLGNTVSVFPLVLTAFLLGTGFSAILGTWLYGLLQRRRMPASRLFAATAWIAGLLVLVTPYILLSDKLVGPDQMDRLADAAPRNPWPILGIIVLPTIFLGGLLPIAIRMLQGREASDSTRGAATLYALNTAGGLLGAGIANHYLVPAFGVHVVLLLLTAICLAAGLATVASARHRSGPRSLAWAGALVLLVIGGGSVIPRMMDLYAAKIARSTKAEIARVLHVREGRAATVTVIEQDSPRLGTYRDMYLNGVEEASTRYWHTQLFKLLGVLPILIHESEQPKDVLVIAFGAGITAGSTLASSEVAALDVVDLNPDIEGINDLFTEVNGNVFHQDRFHFHNDDGRNYLVTSAKQYDLIIGDSTHPRAYDSWILYTEEFYQAARRRLKPGGIFAQWVPVLGSMQGDLMRIHLNTFRRVFPHATFWYVYGSDQAFLMATPEALSIDARTLQVRLDRLPEWFKAEEYQIDTVERIAGFFWLDEQAMDRMIGDERRINRDDVHYFDKQSAVWPLPPHRRLPAFQASALGIIDHLDAAQRSRVAEQQTVAQLLSRYGFYDSKEALYDAFCLMPANGNVSYFMGREFANQLPDRKVFCLEREIRRFREAVARAPDDPIALNGLADCLMISGDLDEGLRLAERAATIAPDNGMVLDTYGWGLLQKGENQKALAVLRRSAAALPEHPVVLFHLGAAYRANGDAARARTALEAALRISERFDGADQARTWLGISAAPGAD